MFCNEITLNMKKNLIQCVCLTWDCLALAKGIRAFPSKAFKNTS